MYGVGVSFIGIAFTLVFVKIGQLFKKLKSSWKQTRTITLLLSSLPFYFVRRKVRLKMRLTVLLKAGHDDVNNEGSTCVEERGE